MITKIQSIVLLTKLLIKNDYKKRKVWKKKAEENEEEFLNGYEDIINSSAL